jgi:hypothetical protein
MLSQGDMLQFSLRRMFVSMTLFALSLGVWNLLGRVPAMALDSSQMAAAMFALLCCALGFFGAGVGVLTRKASAGILAAMLLLAAGFYLLSVAAR